MEYPRGSEWRKWDLHIHTPMSILNNEFGNNFDEYVKILFKRAIEKDIAVIGITDYFCIEGYKKIKQDYLSNIDKLNELFSHDEVEKIKGITVLPNIEFRLNKIVGTNRINFHVIFSDDVEIKDIEENFLHELDFVYEGDPYNVDQKRKLKISNLEKLGKKLKEEHSPFKNDSDLFIGMKCAVIDDNQCVSILKKNIFNNKYLIFIPTDEDLSQIGWDSQDHLVRKVIIQKAHGLLASNNNTIKWGLGEFSATKKEFIREFKSIKPSIWGSDAHSYQKLFMPEYNRFCRIKADPTFEGLKQIIYEPDRVKIQEIKPEEKENYLVIDKVKFIDDKSFEPKEIFLNQNLNSIIGGKSTGKSILLRNIAQAIDGDEVSNRLNEVQLDDYKNEVSGFHVVRKDGRIDKKGEKGDILPRKIIYIPQSYLNRLVDKKEEKNSIDEIILNVLRKESKIRDVFDEFENRKRSIEKDISHDVEELFYIIKDGLLLRKQVKELGDKLGIQKEIQKYTLDIQSLKNSINITDKEIEDYNEYKLKNIEIQKKIETIKCDMDIISYITGKSPIILDNEIIKILPSFSEETYKNFELISKNAINKAQDLLFGDLDNWRDSLVSNLKALENKRKTILGLIEPLSKKFEVSVALTEKLKNLEIQEKRLENVEKEEKKLEDITNRYNECLKRIVDNHAKFYDLFVEIKGQLLQQGSITEGNGLKFDIDILFEEKRFQEEFVDAVINRSKLSKTNFEYLIQYGFESNSKFEQNVKEISIGLLNNSLQTKNGYTSVSAINKLLQCRYSFHYNISEDGDSLSDMSPGRKSSVLLKLLIQLDNSQCPILLDQPEDDLDNRSIYDDLVGFIKNKKKSRQIIIATHNPNLVVGGDSECIIVANQSGKNSINKSPYKFEYVEGSLENTFVDTTENSVLYRQGIKEHVCEILEGGEEAFDQRKKQYGFIK